MGAFPQSIHFSGSNLPRRVELSVQNLAVVGEIPPEVDGAFFRAVPDNAHAPMFDDDVALNADGMISRFNIEGGAVDFGRNFAFDNKISDRNLDPAGHIAADEVERLGKGVHGILCSLIPTQL